MRFLIYIIIFLNIINIVKCDLDKCTPYKCQWMYKPCSKPGQMCSDVLYCNIHSDNSTDTIPVCYPRIEEFENCQYNSQCKRGTVCLRDGYCKEVGFKGFGEVCYITEDCSTGLDCMNNTCTHTVQQCTQFSCPYGKYCSPKKVCTPLIADGEECDPLKPQCFPGSICTGSFNNTICRQPYSKKEGDRCNNDNTCDISKGLGCKNGVCKKYTPTPNKKAYCLDDTACFIGIEKCICNNVTQHEGKCQQVIKATINCTQSYHAYYACLAKNQCNINIQNPNSPRSCLTKNCSEELCKYQSNCMIPEYSCERLIGDPKCAPTASTATSQNLPTTLLFITTLTLLLKYVFV